MSAACLHPIVVDFQDPPRFISTDWWRGCALCDLVYNRTEQVLAPLRRHCEAAWSIDFRRFVLDDEDAVEIAG